MRWPLVSRAEHDREIAEFRADIARALDARDQERADRLEDQARADQRYDALLARYHQLQLQGFTPKPVVVETPPATIDPVIAAINAASAGKDARVRAAMLLQASIDRRASLSEEAIVQRIYRGSRPADDFLTSTPSGGSPE